MTNLKIAVLGPSISGKSGISNILAGLNESLTSQYNETKGVRILEFDKVVSTGLKDNTTVVSIELWDFSGASDSAPNLFALIPNLNGILFVYPHPSSTNSLQTNTDYWTRHNLNVKCNAIVFANCITSSSKESIKVKFSSSVLANAPIVNTSLEAPNSITSEFDKFIGKSYRMFIEARNKEETV